MDESPAIPLPFQLSRLVSSVWIPQAIYAAAELGIADALAAGPLSCAELARRVGADADALRRLLRGLSALGLCATAADGAVALTPLGDCLRSDSPNSVRSWARLIGGPMVWGSWAELVECVRSGRSVPELRGAGDTFAQLAADPQASAVFDDAMVELTRHLAPLVAATCDLAGVRELVDVGGGHGAVLPAIALANPGLRARVYDLPHCAAGAARLFAAAGVGERCGFEAGSMFERVPAGADAYLLKSVLHDWDDERCVAILRNCRAAMGETARLLIVEIVVPTGGASPLDAMIASTDLNMLVATGGRERTEPEYRTLLTAAGLRLLRVVPMAGVMSVIEARI